MKSDGVNVACALPTFGVLVILLVQIGCVTRSVDIIVGPSGVRFNGGQVQDKIVCSGVVRQKYSPLKWENDGRFASHDREIWWRETASGDKKTLRGDGRLDGMEVTFYPMVGINGWLGVGLCPSHILIPIVNDVVGKGLAVRIRPQEYAERLRVAKRFSSRGELPMTPEEEQKAFDPFLFDGNRRLMFRTFNPDEQYYEYDALHETLKSVTTNRVAEVKRIYSDLYRIPVGPYSYWKEDKNGQLQPDNKYYHPLDPVKDAVPQW